MKSVIQVQKLFLKIMKVYGNKFEDPMRRTPSIDKIVKATNYEPTMTIQKMIEEIITYKKINL